MENEGSYRYASRPGWQAVELPYKGGHLAMDVVVPAQGRFAALTRSLTPELLNSVLGAMRPTPMTLDLPRFAFDSRPAVTDVLKKQMRSAFDPATADFSGIPASPSEKLFLSTVEHEVQVAVDESGTTAAAGSGGGMTAGATPAPAMHLRVDRPFVFVIRDTSSGRPLFLGQVTAPGSRG
jgi:serpin B